MNVSSSGHSCHAGSAEVAFGEHVTTAIAKGRARWPLVRVAPAEFATFLSERERARAECFEDLYLACACCRGDGAAIAAFEAAYLGEVERVAARVRVHGLSTEDLKQILRDKLFVGANGQPPKIGTYGGAGDLRNWLRVAATRIALNLGRAGRGRAEDSLQSTYPDKSDDPELAYLKRLYRKEFAEAFAVAMNGLPARDRNLLRYTTMEQLDADTVAGIYGVHKATVNRWLAEARRTLLVSVKDNLRRRLRVSASELESILALIESRLEVVWEAGPGPDARPGSAAG